MSSKWIRIAKKVAQDSRHDQHRLAALVVKGGAILAAEANRECQRGHAEARALRPHRDFTGATMYVFRAGGKQVSRPCYACTQKIKASGISYVVYFDGSSWCKVTPDELANLVPPYAPPPYLANSVVQYTCHVRV